MKRNTTLLLALASAVVLLGTSGCYTQLTVRDDASAARLEEKGVEVVMNRCPKIEYGRLSREIGWNGVNSRIISSKKPVMRSGVQSFGIRDVPGRK